MATQSEAIPAAPTRSAAKAREERLGQLLVYGTATLIAAVLLVPVVWTIATSLKTQSEVYLVSRFFPSSPQWSNYQELFDRVPFARWIWNTVFVTLLATAGTVLSSLIVGYSFARFRYPGRNLIFLITIGTLILPTEVVIVPQYLLFRELGWLNTYLPLIVPYWLGGTAFYIFLFRQFLMTIPRELDEAARLDGANSLQILFQVLVPLCKPAIGAAVVISFIQQWDEFFTHLIYLNTPEKYTLSIGLRYFYNSLHTEGEPMMHLLMAAATLAVLPPIVLFALTQRYFVRGVVMSGLKG